MPPKTAKHGGARKNGGRKSKSGEFSNEKTPEEKLKSHRERMAKNRGQLKVPAARSDDGKDCESVRIGTGRPPLDPEAGPMKGAVRAEYKLENQRQNRKKQKIRQIR